MTLEEAWSQKKPILSHHERTKWNSKAKKYIFVGYCETSKGYRFLETRLLKYFDPRGQLISVDHGNVLYDLIIPMESKLNLINGNGGTELTKKPFRQLLGFLMYLMLPTRLDLSFPLNVFSRIQDKATSKQWNYLTRVLNYLKFTKELRLTYGKNEDSRELICYVDSDWGSDATDRKSVLGFLYKIYGNTVAWSTLQNIIIYEDNNGCISIIKNPENTRKTKHIDLEYHFVDESYKKALIILNQVLTADQQAGILIIRRLIYFQYRDSIGNLRSAISPVPFGPEIPVPSRPDKLDDVCDDEMRLQKQEKRVDEFEKIQAEIVQLNKDDVENLKKRELFENSSNFAKRKRVLDQFLKETTEAQSKQDTYHLYRFS
ncbi:hypothetical protein ILUMI_09650 [Ignelater luminosus]|uniref:Retroviral polymerase SH3-like domain-containing protein n=1 Tax=Ignelater luminosus TaxID=2038154 RepID=A0A8K0D5E2_IGNLU|nr:hypothetical protein ILUMI_09650 [Ignelater luminosus]